MPAVAERPAIAAYTLHHRQGLALYQLGLTQPQNPEPVEELLYGGQAGGGKSHLLRALGILLCEYWPGTRVALFRRTYPELEETHIARIRQEVPPERATYHEARHELRFPNGSVLAFRFCERLKDVYRYQSAEWEALLLDEATHFTGDMVAYLRTRVRSTRPGWKPKIVYATNPGNVGHLYFKSQFVDAGPPETVYQAAKEDGGLRRFFLRARLQDNPSLGEDYRRVLEGLPDPAERAALLEGSWDVFAGQFFASWRRELHTCDPFEIPAHWTTRGTSTDWGYGAPWSTHFWVRDEDRWQRDRKERWYVYREFYAAKVMTDEQARKVADAIAADDALYAEQRATRPFLPPRLTWSHIADPNMWNKLPMSNHSAEETYALAGVALTRGNNHRVHGWQRFREFLAVQDDGKPGAIYFRGHCANAIRTLPAMVYDKTNPEESQEGAEVEDHVADENRYWFMSRGSLLADVMFKSAPLGTRSDSDPKLANRTPPEIPLPPMYPEWNVRKSTFR